MKRHVSPLAIRWIAAAALALGLPTILAQAQWNQTLFSDNFYTGLSASPASATTDLNYNIGLSGGRQNGSLVVANPVGFGWSMYGKTVFDPNNGWDLRAQSGFPASGPIDPWTLRYRDNVANEWSTVTPNIGFDSFILDHSYRIQAQLLHVHPDNVGANDRWMGVIFGAQPVVRFVNVVDNGGIIVFASGAYQIWADGTLAGFGAVSIPVNGAYDVDIRVLNNLGAIYINNTLVASSLDFSGVTPAWIGLSSLSGTDSRVSASTQFRFDNFAVATVPEPSTFALFGLALGLFWAGLSRRRP